MPAVAVVTAIVTATAPGGQAQAGPATVAVGVHTERGLATIASGALGVNTPIWNPRLTDPEVPGLLRRAGVTMLEFNGGGVSDLYHWRDGSLSHDPDAANHPYDYFSLKPQFSFDQFADVARAADARTLVHANYGTGTPQEAADWVAYARRRHLGGRDWAVGEEVWGNGSIDADGYTINFEPDAHSDKSPTAYGTNAVEFIRAMKAADPTIRVGIELTGVNWEPMRRWDEAVLARAGHAVDFVDVHWYPFGAPDTSDAALLQVPRQTPANLATLREMVDRYSGGRKVDIVVGETNSATVQAPQQISMFNALYLADDILTLLENGGRAVAWWALHNGGYVESGGDLGLLSTGECDDAGTHCAPPANTPFPAYHAMRLVGSVVRAGGRLVATTSADPLVVTHSVREPDGSLVVVLLNEDPDTARRIHLDLGGHHQERSATTLRYARGDDGVRVGRTSTAAVELPAYSVTTVVVPAGPTGRGSG